MIDTISVEDVKLGRLVLRPHEPHQDYYDPSYTAALTLSKTKAESLQDFRRDATSTTFKAKMKALFTAGIRSKKHTNQSISAAEVEIYKLRNSGDVFVEACKDPNARAWIEAACNGGSDVYLIVGYSVTTGTRYSFTRDANILGEVAAGVSAPTPAGDTVDIEANASHERQHEERLTAHFPGQTVHDVQYRKLKFKFLSSKRLENGALEKGSRWKSAGVFRGEDEDFDEDVLDVSLEEEVTKMPVKV